MDRNSFTTQTDAVTHDSDPRLLEFERLSVQPEDMTGEGRVTETLGTTLDLGSIGSGDIPAFTGPIISDLTGGLFNTVEVDMSRNINVEDLTGDTFPSVTLDLTIEGDPIVNPVKFQDLTGGGGTLTIQSTDLSVTITHNITAADLVTLAAAQGHSTDNLGNFDLGSLFPDLSTLAVKEIGTVTWVPTGLTASTGTVDNTGSIFQPAILIGEATVLFTGEFTNTLGPELIGPETVNETPTLTANILIASSAPGPINHDIVQFSGAQFATDAVTAGNHGQTSANIDMGTTTFTGTITDVSVTINAAITSSPTGVDLASSNLQFSYDGSTIGFNTPLSFPGSTDQAISVVADNVKHLSYTIISAGRATGSVIVGISATTIQSNCTVPELASQNVLIGLGATEFIPFQGWDVNGATATVTDGYGPDPGLGAGSSIRIQFGESGFVGDIGLITPIGTSNLVYTASPPMPGTIVTDRANVTLTLDLVPKSTPENFGSQVITVPYELRQRNLPAFKFKFAGTFPESPPTIDVGCFVSQGDPLVDPNNTHREWCPCPVDVIAAPAQKEVAFPLTLSVGQQVTNMPDGFSGAMLIIPKEFTGPWNYIRFTISLSTGEEETDLSGITLQITANAREVI